MKKIIFLQLILLSYLLIYSEIASSEQNKQITHVVMVWLKEPGNEKQRDAFVKASKQLNNISGIVNRHVGVVVASDRVIVDDTFDVAVSVTLESEQALKKYLNDPLHKKILHDKIKPLINRIVVYDFVSP